MANPNRRRIKLIQPRLQIRMILAFLGVTALALTLQFLLFTSSLARLASELPADGDLLLERVPEQVLVVLLVSALVVLPLTFSVGILITFRIAGPLYRMRRFLDDVAAGRRPAECRLRKGDELQDFCEALNRATAPLRAAEERPAAEAVGTTRSEAA
jgi:hypothetical protein